MLAATLGGGNITDALIGGVLLDTAGTALLFGAAAALGLATLAMNLFVEQTIGVNAGNR